MHIRRRETLAARKRLRTRSDRFSNKCSALLVELGLVFDCLQHKRMG
jgi:hypothetical protein